jgi:putative sigma-54 modulation protein
MRINIVMKNLKNSEALEEKINEKCQKIERLFKKGISVNWTSYLQEGIHYTQVDVNGPGLNLHASAKADNLYKTFDMALDKLERQVEKKRKKIKEKLHKKAHLVILDPEQAWTDYDEDYFSDAA